MDEYGSRDVASRAVIMAISENRDIEISLKNEFMADGFKTAAVDFGGEFISSVNKIIERAVVAAKRESIIDNNHNEEGAVAGATKEALSQIMPKALGLNVGGKIGIARFGEHICVAIFFGIGLLHLNEMAIGLGHRVA